ncbi:hypothetical protein EK21DRAFT_117311 [Setomelanomma holmii]|uniref:Uncharacterized protein n=1 Tax=Setomelanomma holmii TaxID=210430 RepID=A0A9P4GXU7_9PLEO|nr:hypothetical protein EK21DRAFT_117311 [Setomelanomma holmii]
MSSIATTPLGISWPIVARVTFPSSLEHDKIAEPAVWFPFADNNNSNCPYDNIKKALSSVEVYAMLSGGPRNKLADLRGVDWDKHDRKRGMSDIFSIVHRIDLGEPKPDIKQLLRASNEITILQKELCLFRGTILTFDPQILKDLIKEFAEKACEVSLQTDTDAATMDAQPSNTDNVEAASSAPSQQPKLQKQRPVVDDGAMDAEQFMDMNSHLLRSTPPQQPAEHEQQPVVDEDAMNVEPTFIAVQSGTSHPHWYLPPYVNFDDDGLSDEEAKALQLHKSPSPSLNSLSQTTRREAIVYMCKRFRRMNLRAIQKCTQRLTENQVIDLALMTEGKILNKLHDEVQKVGGNVTPDQLAEAYCDCINKSIGKLDSFKAFLNRVKNFHGKIRGIIGGIGRSIASFCNIKQKMDDLDHPQVPQPVQQQAPAPAVSMDEAQQTWFNKFKLDIFLANVHAARKNNGVHLLQDYQIRVMSCALEQHVFDELENKSRHTTVSLEKAIQEYTESSDKYARDLCDLNKFEVIARQWLRVSTSE